MHQRPLDGLECCVASMKKKEVGKTANKSHTDGKKEGGSFVIAHLSVETQFNQGSHRVEFTRFRRPTTTVNLSQPTQATPTSLSTRLSSTVVLYYLKATE